MSVQLRKATLEDVKKIFDWRNDPWIISLSASQKGISWEEHVQWFQQVINQNNHLLLIIKFPNEEDIGSVRFDCFDDTKAVVTIYLLAPYTNQGWGTIALTRASHLAFNHWPNLSTIHGFIQNNNLRSIKSFTKAGFELVQVQGTVSHQVEMILHRNKYCIEANPNSSNWSKDNLFIVKYYSDLIKQHQFDYRALDWGSRASQELRFKVLLEIGDLHQKNILDVGCGFGDLLRYLKKREIEVNYTGYDIVPEMIDYARQSFPESRFELCDLMAESETLLQFDYVFASGIFYLRQSEAMLYMESMVQKMFKLCRRGVAFNTLSIEAQERTIDEFYADPVQVLKMCLPITSKAVIRHDYLLNDFTVYLYKE